MMDENTARYIVRMIIGYRENCLPLDATDKDAEQFDIMHERYLSAGRWSAGLETALAEFVMRIAENGVPGGEYLTRPDEAHHIDRYLQQRGIPRIVRQ